MQKMKQWLEGLPNRTASVNSQEQSDMRSYRFTFFQIGMIMFMNLSILKKQMKFGRSEKVERKYAHEVFEDDPPYDGLLW